jgi:hypothetical protein
MKKIYEDKYRIYVLSLNFPWQVLLLLHLRNHYARAYELRMKSGGFTEMA